MKLTRLNLTGRCLLLLFLISSASMSSFAQSGGSSESIKKLVSALSTRQNTDSLESVYVQFDKTVYGASDTLWYKAYVFDANSLTSPGKSGILHVDVLNAEHAVVKRFLVPLVAGLGWGYLPLSDAGFSAGQYTLKAYTNWMLNFDERAIFSKVFKVEPDKNADASTALVRNSSSTTGAKDRKVAGSASAQQNYDLQFMPEGGYLVAGVETTIGCKVLSPEGRGISLKGKILNGKGESVAEFQTSERGMANFKFKAQAGEKYKASVALAGATNANYSFPEVSASGTVLNVDNHPDSSKLSIFVRRSESLKANHFYLIMACRAGTYAVDVDLSTDTEQMIQISKKKFPTGILHISLLNEAYVPLNDRLVFINHHDFLNLQVATDKDIYGKRDSIGLSITVDDGQSKPIVGSFSLSVTDDNQVADNLVNGNILTEILLRSGVKGDIEDAGYYMDNHAEAAKGLDVLLLTQGWTAFDWKGLFTNREMKFKAERFFEIQGRVVGAFGAKSRKKVALLGTKPIFLKDTVTDERGYFVFKNLPPFEYPVFQIRTSNARDKSFDLNIEIDEPQFPDFKIKNIQPKPIIEQVLVPNEELTKLKSFQQKLDGTMLKEVNINAIKTVNNSDNLNGPGQADQVLNEADLKKEGRVTLLEVLEKRIKGFMLTANGARINTQPLKFIFDGMDLEFGQNLSFIDLRNELQGYSIENITGLEVAVNMKYTSRYNFRHQENSHLISYVEGGPSYIEITTRAKKGPFAKPARGMYLYRSLPFSLPLKEFYVPKYHRQKAETEAPDLRSTVYWNPNILTDAEGKASFFFYTTDVAGTYTVVVEGSDMNGNLGFFKRKIKVE